MMILMLYSRINVSLILKDIENLKSSSSIYLLFINAFINRTTRDLDIEYF